MKKFILRKGQIVKLPISEIFGSRKEFGIVQKVTISLGMPNSKEYCDILVDWDNFQSIIPMLKSEILESNSFLK